MVCFILIVLWLGSAWPLSISVWYIRENWSYLVRNPRCLLSIFHPAKLVSPLSPLSHLCHQTLFPSLDVKVHQNVRTDVLPDRALRHPAILQSQRAPCIASSASTWTQKDKWRANTPQMRTCKNNPVITAAHELGGRSNRWLHLSHFLIPEVVPLCFLSISFPGTWFWQAVGPLESTVSFKVIPGWYAIEANPHATKNQKPRVKSMSHAPNMSVTFSGHSYILTKHIGWSMSLFFKAFGLRWKSRDM